MGQAKQSHAEAGKFGVGISALQFRLTLHLRIVVSVIAKNQSQHCHLL